MSGKEGFEVYFSDLNRKAQKEFLEFEGMETPEEGNYDVFPIAVIPACEED